MTASESWGREQTPGKTRAVDFAAAWPSAHARMTALLRSRGLQDTDVDDVIQDVALRALRDPDRFVSHEHLVSWCCRVAINLHIDTTRRQRRVSGQPPPDVAGTDDTAGTVQHRMALERLMVGIADLSPEEQRLLLDPEPADSRREAVRLAVRRHRLRARLVAFLDGLAAAFPVVRRAWRRPPAPAKAGIAALPIVAVLVLAPLALGPPSAPSVGHDRPATSAHVPLDGSPGVLTAKPAKTSPVAREQARSGGATSPTRSTASRASSDTLLEVDPVGSPVKVSHDRRSDDAPTLCTFGKVVVCVKRPGPALHPPQAPRLP